MPGTMIGRAALAVWQQIGKGGTPLDEAVHILGSIRLGDLDLACKVAADLNLAPADVIFAWTRMIEAIMNEAPQEKAALESFEIGLEP